MKFSFPNTEWSEEGRGARKGEEKEEEKYIRDMEEKMFSTPPPPSRLSSPPLPPRPPTFSCRSLCCSIEKDVRKHLIRRRAGARSRRQPQRKFRRHCPQAPISTRGDHASIDFLSGGTKGCPAFVKDEGGLLSIGTKCCPAFVRALCLSSPTDETEMGNEA